MGHVIQNINGRYWDGDSWDGDIDAASVYETIEEAQSVISRQAAMSQLMAGGSSGFRDGKARVIQIVPSR